MTSELEVSGLSVTSGALLREPTGAPGSPLWGFSDLGLDLARVKLAIARAGHAAALPALLPDGALAVVNGGYFEANFAPSTWVVSNGVELSPKSDTSKGGLLAISGGSVYLGPFSALTLRPELAVQSFPLIVEADAQSGIHRDDGRRAARTVACLVGDALHLIVIAAPRGEGPTLFESSALLRAPAPGGFGCRVALNLDGGPSSGVWFSPRVRAKQRAPLADVAYALAIEPR